MKQKTEDQLIRQLKQKGYRHIHADHPFLSDDAIITYRDSRGITHTEKAARKDPAGWVDDLEILDILDGGRK